MIDMKIVLYDDLMDHEQFMIYNHETRPIYQLDSYINYNGKRYCIFMTEPHYNRHPDSYLRDNQDVDIYSFHPDFTKEQQIQIKDKIKRMSQLKAFW